MIEVDGKGADRLREDSHTGPACSNSCELLRFSPLRKIEIMALLNFDTIA